MKEEEYCKQPTSATNNKAKYKQETIKTTNNALYNDKNNNIYNEQYLVVFCDLFSLFNFIILYFIVF
jgi:hypothetical protein